MLKHLTILTLLISTILAQDFQVEVHRPFELPVLPDSITLDEFQLINRDLGWKELFTTVIFPGYASKFAREDSLATYIIIGRYLGVAAMSAVTLNALFDPDIDTDNFQALAESSSSNAAVFIAGFSTNVILTIFDWGYANLRLKQKQDEILFKYRQKPDLRSVDVWDGMQNIQLPSIPEKTP